MSRSSTSHGGFSSSCDDTAGQAARPPPLIELGRAGRVLVLGGPTGVGKNTIATALARRLVRCSIIDFDAIRNMFARPHLPPWAGEAGRDQNRLGVVQACDLAHNFVDAGYDVIILDVVTNDTAALYRERLSGVPMRIVHLMADWDTIRARNQERMRREGAPRLTDDELRLVYGWAEDFEYADVTIDTTTLDVNATTAAVLDAWR